MTAVEITVKFGAELSAAPAPETLKPLSELFKKRFAKTLPMMAPHTNTQFSYSTETGQILQAPSGDMCYPDMFRTFSDMHTELLNELLAEPVQVTLRQEQ